MRQHVLKSWAVYEVRTIPGPEELPNGPDCVSPKVLLKD